MRNLPNVPRDFDDELIEAIEDAETVEELQAAVRGCDAGVVLEFHEDHCDDDPCTCEVERITVGEFAPKVSA